jgi:hypothetical protein
VNVVGCDLSQTIRNAAEEAAAKAAEKPSKKAPKKDS